MRSSRFRSDSEADSGRFDFAPMVDVVLVLVIFFMLASNMINSDRKLQIQLPQAKSSTAQAGQPLTIDLSKTSEITIDGKLVTLQDLTEVVKPRLSANGGSALLRADRAAPYGNVVKIMDIIKLAGGTQLALATVSQ